MTEESPRGAVSAHPRCVGLMPASQVYFVLARSAELVKIGYAKDAWARLSSMQVGSPDELLLFGVIDTYLPRQLEQDLHERFAAERVRGEWFRMTDALFDYVMKHGREAWDDTPAATDQARPLQAGARHPGLGEPDQ